MTSSYGISNLSCVGNSRSTFNSKIDLITTASKIHEFLNIVKDCSMEEKRDLSILKREIKEQDAKNTKGRNKKFSELMGFFQVKQKEH
jgi:hypothetical protein